MPARRRENLATFNTINLPSVIPVVTAQPVIAQPVIPIQPITIPEVVVAQPQPVIQPVEVTEVVAVNPQLVLTTIPSVATLANVRTFNPAFLAVFNPGLIKAPAVPRDELQVPISPEKDITDKVLLEDPSNPSKKYYIPRYRIAEQTTTTGQQYRVSLERIGDQWGLVIYLEKFRPSETDNQAATEMQTSIDVVLKYWVRIGGAGSTKKELTFQEITEDVAGWRAVLKVSTMPERDQIYKAMTDSDYRAMLVVRRGVRVAILASEQSASEPLFEVVQRTLEDQAEPPFPFERELHPYIYREVSQVSDQRTGYIPRTVSWQGEPHRYYQDEVTRHLFHYLPDSYKIARQPEAPYTPRIRVRFTSADGSLDNMQATLEYVAVPVVDLDRLEDAASSLKGFLPPGVSEPAFGPLAVDADQIRYLLRFPRADGSTSPSERPGVINDICVGIYDSLDMPLEPAFQSIFDAMFGGSAVLFTGDVIVDMGEESDQVIRFEGRLNDLAGKLLDEIETPDEASGSVQVTLRNAIESPVRVESLPVEIRWGEQEVSAHIDQLTKDGAEVSLPVDLAPNEELQFTAVPDGSVPGDGTLDALFDVDEVKALPDRGAVLSAILDPSVPAEYKRSIQVMGFAETFTPHTDIKAIVFDFERGESIVLQDSSPKADATLYVPLRDYILRGVLQGEYRYKMTVVRQDSSQTSDDDWRTASTGILIPNVS